MARICASLGMVLLVIVAMTTVPSPVRAASSRVVVTVDDQPITDYDIDQRIKLKEALGYRPPPGDLKKKALQELIDDVAMRAEAKRNKVEITDKQLQEAIDKLAKGASTTAEQLQSKLKEKGVGLSALKRHVQTTLIMRWLMARDGASKPSADAAEIDRRLNSITNDPRFKPVLIYEIVQVDLPVEDNSAMRQQLMYARAVELQQIMAKYTGCGSLRSAVSEVFNVKIGKPIEAMADKLPPELRKALDSSGTKKLIGPVAGPSGVRLIGFCGKKTMSPPMPTREVVENMVLNEKYSASAEKTMRELRRKVFVDYKDASLQQ